MKVVYARKFKQYKYSISAVRQIYSNNKKSKGISIPEQKNMEFKKAQGSILLLLQMLIVYLTIIT